MSKTLLVRHEVVSKELHCVSIVHSMWKRVVANLFFASCYPSGLNLISNQRLVDSLRMI